MDLVFVRVLTRNSGGRMCVGSHLAVYRESISFETLKPMLRVGNVDRPAELPRCRTLDKSRT
jgi:hypothetical protein